MTRIGELFMCSDVTPVIAVKTADGWAVSWISGRCVDRNQAITAMTVAEVLASGVCPGARMWPHVEDWVTGELGLPMTAVLAVPGSAVTVGELR
jgi:hypothetical protein